MLNKILARFYERDLRLIIEDLNLFKDEADLWRTTGTITNPAGNLVLHLIGGMNHHIGKNIGGSNYVRDRDREFTEKNISRKELIDGLESLITVVNQTLSMLTQQGMTETYPAFFDQPGTSIEYVLIQLLAHLNYHRGQINYLRRAMI